MKKLIPFLSLLLVGCVAPKKEALSQNADLVGTYLAEHVIDTHEELVLQADGKFSFHFLLVGGGEDSWYDGRWQLRAGRVILWAHDKEGKEVDFPMEIRRQKDDLALIYSGDSFSHAKAIMLLPNTYRRTSTQTPNQAPQPTSGLAPGRS